jgi:hypothetical protein
MDAELSTGHAAQQREFSGVEWVGSVGGAGFIRGPSCRAWLASGQAIERATRASAAAVALSRGSTSRRSA